MEKCEFPEGVQIKPNGVDELDPCLYEDVEMYVNVTVIVSKCKKCGNLDISWIPQDNTERIELS